MTRQTPQQQPPPIIVTDGRKPGWYWIDDSINLHYARQIKAAGIAVYTALVMASKGRHEFSVDIDTLAALAGLDRDAAMAAIKRLEDAQPRLISIFRARGCSNVYRILDAGALDPTTNRPKPVGKTDCFDPNQSEKPTTPPVGKTDYPDPNQSEKPTTVVGKTDCFSPNQSEKPTALTPNSPLRRDPRRRIHTPTTESENDDDARARNAPQPQPQTWDDLIALYGAATVIAAQDAASNQSKRIDLAYIRGVLRRRARQGAPPKRPDIFAPRPAAADLATDADADQPQPESPEPDDSHLQSAILNLESPWSATVASLSIGMTNGTAAMLASVDATVEGDTLVIVAPTNYARGWLQNRLGDRILDAWRRAGGEQVSQVSFTAAPAGRDRGQGEPS